MRVAPLLRGSARFLWSSLSSFSRGLWRRPFDLDTSPGVQVREDITQHQADCQRHKEGDIQGKVEAVKDQFKHDH